MQFQTGETYPVYYTMGGLGMKVFSKAAGVWLHSAGGGGQLGGVWKAAP